MRLHCNHCGNHLRFFSSVQLSVASDAIAIIKKIRPTGNIEPEKWL